MATKEAEMRTRLMPTGECWCGCGAESAIGSFFLAGHDKVAESRVIQVQFGGVPELLAHYGYQPGGPSKLQDEWEAWRARGGRPR
jgi:hypothetical protein